MKHSSLQDYQEQLLLLERPCQNYNRPTMQQGQDSGIADADFKSIAQIDSTKSDDERKKELRDYQMSLMNLSCRQRKGHPMLSSHQPTSSQGTANISPSDTDLVASWHAEDVSRDLDFDTTPSQDGKGIQDALQDFNFDSFLRQDGMGADSADYKHNITGREVKKAPACQNPAARTKTQEYDAASVIVPIRSKLQSITPEITQVNLEKPLLFVNPKQFHRIIVRRVARQKPRTTVASQPSKSPRRHGLHAQRRPRGPSGRFLTLKEILQQAEKREEGIIQGVKGQPDRFSDLQLIKTLGDRLMMIGNDGRASSRTQIWWVAYTSLQESDLATYASITSELESKIGVFESDPSPYKWLWSMMPAKPISRDRHELKEIVALRNSIINVVVTVDKQLGLEIATVGWACVYVCLAVSTISFSSLQSADIQLLAQRAQSFLQGSHTIRDTRNRAVSHRTSGSSGCNCSLRRYGELLPAAWRRARSKT